MLSRFVRQIFVYYFCFYCCFIGNFYFAFSNPFFIKWHYLFTIEKTLSSDTWLHFRSRTQQMSATFYCMFVLHLKEHISLPFLYIYKYIYIYIYMAIYLLHLIKFSFVDGRQLITNQQTWNTFFWHSAWLCSVSRILDYFCYLIKNLAFTGIRKVAIKKNFFRDLIV